MAPPPSGSVPAVIIKEIQCTIAVSALEALYQQQSMKKKDMVDKIYNIFHGCEQKQAELDAFTSRKKQRMDPLITGVLNSVRSATGMLSAGDSKPSVVNTGSVSVANSSVTHTGGS
jgi:hypothetical protein